MTLIHNIPSIESRLSELENQKKLITERIIKTESLLLESKKTFNSILLQMNELRLMLNLRDGKWMCIDTESNEPIPLNFVGKEGF